MTNLFLLYTKTCEQSKKDEIRRLKINAMYGKQPNMDSLVTHQAELIKHLLEENAKYKERILGLIERDLVLVDKYAMPDFKLGLRHAKTIILMEAE